MNFLSAGLISNQTLIFTNLWPFNFLFQVYLCRNISCPDLAVIGSPGVAFQQNMKVAQMGSPPERELNELEVELVKMKDVNHDIRVVLQTILNSKDFDKTVQGSILHEFQNELCLILSKVRLLPLKHTKYTGPHLKLQDNRIGEPKVQEGIYEKQTKRRYDNNLNDLYDINEQLSEENDVLSKKLQQAEEYIKKLATQNSLLINSMNLDGQKQPRRSEVSYSNNEPVYSHYSSEVEQLRADLKEAEEFISKNNEEFVKELQKYNEKIWKLQRDLDETRNRLYLVESTSHEQDLLINKLRQENFQLQVLTRNLKAFVNQQERYQYKDVNYTPISQETDRPRKNSKLKEYFQEKIQEGLRYRKQSES